jgi:hypothetical protein
LEEVLAVMHENVLWANGMNGGHVYGRHGVRGYWSHQWAMIDPHVEPVSVAIAPDRQITVEVHQTLRDREGKLLSDRMVGLFSGLRDGLVRRLDIRAN